MRLGALIATLALVGACTEERAPAPPPPPTETRAAEPAAPADDAPAEGAPEPPVDELTEPELEAACFRGRQEACDRLGH